MKNLGLQGEELNAVIEYSTTPDMFGDPKEDSLTKEELDDLTQGRLTLGLMGKARRVLALIEIHKRTTKQSLEFFATRSEIKPLEEATEYGGMMIMAIFKALVTKGVITKEDITQALRDVSIGEVTWDG